MSALRGPTRPVRILAGDQLGTFAIGAAGVVQTAACALGHTRLKGFFSISPTALAAGGGPAAGFPRVRWFNKLTGTALVTRVLAQDPTALPTGYWPLALDASAEGISNGLPVEGMYCSVEWTENGVAITGLGGSTFDCFAELIPG